MNIEQILTASEKFCKEKNAPELLKTCLCSLIMGDENPLKEHCSLLHWMWSLNANDLGEIIGILFDLKLLLGEKARNTISMMAEETDLAYNPKRRGDRFDEFADYETYKKILLMLLIGQIIKPDYTFIPNKEQGSKSILAGVMYISYTELNVFKHKIKQKNGRMVDFTKPLFVKWCKQRFSLDNFEQMKDCHLDDSCKKARDFFPQLKDMEEIAKKRNKY